LLNKDINLPFSNKNKIPPTTTIEIIKDKDGSFEKASRTATTQNIKPKIFVIMFFILKLLKLK